MTTESHGPDVCLHGGNTVAMRTSPSECQKLRM